MAKLKGLGRGLDALLSSNVGGPENDERASLSVELLRPGKYQPRSQMDPAALGELSESIRAQGIIQPILVRPIEDGYEIIAGERRWRAAQMAGLSEVPVLIRNVPDEAALAMSLIENIQREDLNPLEEAIGIQRLIEEFQMTHERAADAVGRSRSAVSNLLRLLNLSAPVQELLVSAKIDMGHARALLSLPAAKQIQAGQEIAAKQLNVREAERLVKRWLSPKRHQVPATENRDVKRLEEELAERLGTRIFIKANPSGKGKLTIEFSNLEQLEQILQKIV